MFVNTCKCLISAKHYSLNLITDVEDFQDPSTSHVHTSNTISNTTVNSPTNISYLYDVESNSMNSKDSESKKPIQDVNLLKILQSFHLPDVGFEAATLGKLFLTEATGERLLASVCALG